MGERPSRDDLLELIDWLWAERHDPTRQERSLVPVMETPLGGWTLEAALSERQRQTDPREAAAATRYAAAPEANQHNLHVRAWPEMTEEQRNEWRRAAGAPQYPPTPMKPPA